MSPFLGPVIDLIGKAIERFVPDPQKKAEINLELVKMAQAGEFKVLDAEVELAKEQIKVNAIEAASPDLFRGGWRPATGWVCVCGFAYMVVVRPILPWIVSLFGVVTAPMPPIDTVEIMGLLAGLLGLGGFRTYEKAKGLN